MINILIFLYNPYKDSKRVQKHTAFALQILFGTTNLFLDAMGSGSIPVPTQKDITEISPKC